MLTGSRSDHKSGFEELKADVNTPTKRSPRDFVHTKGFVLIDRECGRYDGLILFLFRQIQPATLAWPTLG